MASQEEAKSVAIPKWALISGFALIVLLVFGLIFTAVSAVMGQGGDEPKPGDEARLSEGATEAGDNSPSLCGLKSGDNSVPTSGEWITWDWEAPIAPRATNSEHGPAQMIADVMPGCYAHTAKGATLAAMNWLALWQSPVRITIFQHRLTGTGSTKEMSVLGADRLDAHLRQTQLSPEITHVKVNKVSDNLYEVYPIALSGTKLTGAYFRVVWWKGDWHMLTVDDHIPRVKEVTKANLDATEGLFSTMDHEADWD